MSESLDVTRYWRQNEHDMFHGLQSYLKDNKTTSVLCRMGMAAAVACRLARSRSIDPETLEGCVGSGWESQIKEELNAYESQGILERDETGNYKPGPAETPLRFLMRLGDISVAHCRCNQLDADKITE